MKNTVFEFKNYRDYLKTKLATTGASRGLRTRLATMTQTHPAFISKVLKGVNDLSPEHIPPTNALFAHTEEESHFFYPFSARYPGRDCRFEKVLPTSNSRNHH